MLQHSNINFMAARSLIINIASTLASQITFPAQAKCCIVDTDPKNHLYTNYKI